MLLAALCTGCVTSKPLVSHAHIGHALTTWHDTPDRAGLLAVAESRAQQAWDDANRGCRSPGSPAAAGAALRASLSALVPEFTKSEAPYGAVRALTGAIDHIEFAASSDDASVNMVSSVAELSGQGAALAEHLLQTAVALRAQLADGQVRCRELVTRLDRAINGAPSDTGGQTPGLLQFRAQLMAMLARETDPPYEPVSRRYVLGLVRLPNGRWDFRIGPPPRREGVGMAGIGATGSYGY